MSRTTEIQDKTIALIARDGFGIDSTFRVVTAETYDPASGETTQTTTDAVVRTSVPIYPRTTPRAADTALRGEATIYVPARDLTFTPSVGQSVTIATVAYTILDVVAHRLTDGVVAYECMIRQGAVAPAVAP